MPKFLIFRESTSFPGNILQFSDFQAKLPSLNSPEIMYLRNKES